MDIELCFFRLATYDVAAAFAAAGQPVVREVMRHLRRRGGGEPIPLIRVLHPADTDLPAFFRACAALLDGSDTRPLDPGTIVQAVHCAFAAGFGACMEHAKARREDRPKALWDWKVLHRGWDPRTPGIADGMLRPSVEAALRTLGAGSAFDAARLLDGGKLLTDAAESGWISTEKGWLPS